MAREFLLVVTDRDKNIFTVEGPMSDDTRWIEAVCAAQDAGRRVNCHTPGEDLDVDRVIFHFSKQFPEPRGSIVRPKLSNAAA